MNSLHVYRNNEYEKELLCVHHVELLCVHHVELLCVHMELLCVHHMKLLCVHHVELLCVHHMELLCVHHVELLCVHHVELLCVHHVEHARQLTRVYIHIYKSTTMLFFSLSKAYRLYIDCLGALFSIAAYLPMSIFLCHCRLRSVAKLLGGKHCLGGHFHASLEAAARPEIQARKIRAGRQGGVGCD